MGYLFAWKGPGETLIIGIEETQKKRTKYFQEELKLKEAKGNICKYKC